MSSPDRLWGANRQRGRPVVGSRKVTTVGSLAVVGSRNVTRALAGQKKRPKTIHKVRSSPRASVTGRGVVFPRSTNPGRPPGPHATACASVLAAPPLRFEAAPTLARRHTSEQRRGGRRSPLFFRSPIECVTVRRRKTQVRDWVNHHVLADVTGLSAANKVTMIQTLMGGWVSGADVATIVRICSAVDNRAEPQAIRAAIHPFDISDFAPRTRVRL